MTDYNENEPKAINDLSDREDEAKWYVVHTYSGYENKVKATIEKMIINRGTIDGVFGVAVPTEEYIDKKDGQSKLKERKMFPSYVLVKMIINDKSWYLVRNTRGVTGFVGPQSKPIPLTEQELSNLGVKSKTVKVETDFEVGDSIKVIDGPFAGFVGVIDSINDEKSQLHVFVDMFGRDTPVELGFEQVKKN